jgi:GntR family transcriptional regulator
VVKRRLSRASPIPLYVQLKTALRDAVQREMRPGQLLPGEQALSRLYHVSRITTRQALTALANEGLIYRARGKGTFVAEPKLLAPLADGWTFRQELADATREPEAEVLSVEHVAADERHVHLLGCAPGDHVLKVKLLWFLGDEPSIYRVVYLPEDVAPTLSEATLDRRSLQRVLRDDFGVRIEHAEETLECVRADEYRASLLGVAPNDPLLLVERVSYLESRSPVEYARTFYRADRYKLRLSAISD